MSRVLMCSGQVYYDLLAAREERKLNDVAMVPPGATLSVPGGRAPGYSGSLSAVGRFRLGARKSLAAVGAWRFLSRNSFRTYAGTQSARSALRGPCGEREPVGGFAQTPSAGNG